MVYENGWLKCKTFEKFWKFKTEHLLDKTTEAIQK